MIDDRFVCRLSFDDPQSDDITFGPVQATLHLKCILFIEYQKHVFLGLCGFKQSFVVLPPVLVINRFGLVLVKTILLYWCYANKM